MRELARAACRKLRLLAEAANNGAIGADCLAARFPEFYAVRDEYVRRRDALWARADRIGARWGVC